MVTERPSSFLKLAQKDTFMSVLRWCAVKRGTRLSPCSPRVALFAALISRFRCAKSASTTAASRRYGCSYLAIACPPCLPLTVAVTHTLYGGDDHGTAPTAVIIPQLDCMHFRGIVKGVRETRMDRLSLFVRSRCATALS